MLHSMIRNPRLRIEKAAILSAGLSLVAAGVLLHGAPRGVAQQKEIVWSDQEKPILQEMLN